MIHVARRICAQYWNPIGVPMRNQNKHIEENLPWHLPEDEYDGYLNHIIKMIADNLPPSEIIEFMSLVETEYLELTTPGGDKHKFLEELLIAHRAQNLGSCAEITMEE